MSNGGGRSLKAWISRFKALAMSCSSFGGIQSSLPSPLGIPNFNLHLEKYVLIINLFSFVYSSPARARVFAYFGL